MTVSLFIYSLIQFSRNKHEICFGFLVPEEFLYDPVSKSYGDPSRRPECKSSTIEFIAPSEYMLRPPQPAVYIFLLDVSRQASESGYIQKFCDILLEEIDKLPGDGRTQIGFITYDRNVHFYSLPEGAIQPTRLSVCDIDGKLYFYWKYSYSYYSILIFRYVFTKPQRFVSQFK